MSSVAATKTELNQLEERIVERLDSFEDRMDERMAKADQRMEKIDERFDEVLAVMSQFAQDVDVRFSRIEHDLAEVKQDVSDLRMSHDRLLNTIDGFITRIDKYETEQAARDRQMERLLAWARKVSAKTGIPLEDL
jgi:chromosome segregation ATPase